LARFIFAARLRLPPAVCFVFFALAFLATTQRFGVIIRGDLAE
jgi:hypothetical protein